MGMEGRGESRVEQAERNSVYDGENSLSGQQQINEKAAQLASEGGFERAQTTFGPAQSSEVSPEVTAEATAQTAAREESEINDIRASIQKTFERTPDTYGLKGSEIIQ